MDGKFFKLRWWIFQCPFFKDREIRQATNICQSIWFELYLKKWLQSGKAFKLLDNTLSMPLSVYCRHLNAVRRSRHTFSLEKRKTSFSKALQRTRTPSRRKVAVSFARLDLRSFSHLRLAPKDILPPHVKRICRLRQLEGHNKEYTYTTSQAPI